MAYELTIARLMVEHGPFANVNAETAFRWGAEAAARASGEDGRLKVFAHKLPNNNMFTRGYIALAAVVAEDETLP